MKKTSFIFSLNSFFFKCIGVIFITFTASMGEFKFYKTNAYLLWKEGLWLTAPFSAQISAVCVYIFYTSFALCLAISFGYLAQESLIVTIEPGLLKELTPNLNGVFDGSEAPELKNKLEIKEKSSSTLVLNNGSEEVIYLGVPELLFIVVFIVGMGVIDWH